MYRQNAKRVWLTAGLVIAAASFPAAGQAFAPMVGPTASQATSAGRGVRFCAPTATVCDTLVPGVPRAAGAGTGTAARGS